MKVIVGLGNVGDKYENTRHNLGFFIIDCFLKQHSNFSVSHKFSSHFYSLILDSSQKIYLCKPTTFMNLSGVSVSGIKNFYGLKNEDFLIVHDDLYIPVGQYKLSYNKGPGGHNGVSNIHNHLGGKNIFTLRIGIGPRDRASIISDYVMEKIPELELKQIISIIPSILNSIFSWLNK